MTGIQRPSGSRSGPGSRAWLAVVTAVMLALSLMATAAPAGAHGGDHPDKVTICHAAGREGTTHYETLTISENAVYGRHGNAGHFEENGTPRAGHEQDYFGECIDDEPALNSASLEVVKLVRSTAQDVPRTLFPFALSAAGETDSFDLADGASKTFDFDFDSDRFEVVVGELTGELADGYSFVSASCAIGDRVIPQPGSRASVSLLDGADVTCTFVNRYDGVPEEDEPSVKVVKDVRGDRGADTTEFDIVVGTRGRNELITLEDGESQTFYPLAGTEDFGIAEQTIGERGWATSISCESDERDGRFGARAASFVIDEVGEGEDIVCTVINTYDDGRDDDDDDSDRRRTTTTTQPALDPPCFDGTAESEAGECVVPAAPADEEIVVLGVQIESTTTTVGVVATDALPFTGDDSTGVVLIGLFALLAGALLLGGSFLETSFITTGRHETSSSSFRGWANK